MLIHEFTISVPVLILPIFRQLLLRNEKIRVNLYCEKGKHTAQKANNSSKVISHPL